MTIIKTICELKNYRNELDLSVGLVPTMGALHKGHLSLIEKSVSQNDKTFVSIFVNPTQFLAGEDIDSYPRKVEEDIEICLKAGVDFLFLPSSSEMYSQDEPMVSCPKIKGFILEGKTRPGHFDGVLTVVLKLLNLVRPNHAYFGKKDSQQLYLLQNMVKNFYLSTKIIPCEIVREQSGLALSSRNAYLNNDEKKEALKLSKSLEKARQMIEDGEINCKIIKKEILEILKPLKVDYVEIVDRNFELLDEIYLQNSIILLAVYVGKARLIDNIWI